MSIVLDLLRDKPVGFWSLEDTSPFYDHSGYGKAASSASTARHAGLANGVSSSPIFTNAQRGQFEFYGFTTGFEKPYFTLEAIVRPVEPSFPIPATTSEQLILGHADTYDGLVINGTVVSFVTKYTNYGESRASFDISTLRSVHVAGVHTPTKNLLYVNGILVAESAVTEEQISDTYATAGTTLYSGQTAGSRKLALACVAVYNYPLSAAAILQHARVANRVPNAEEVVESFGGTALMRSDSTTAVFLEHLIDTDEEWNSGLMVNVASEGGVLRPVAPEGMPRPGVWFGVFPIDYSEIGTISGVRFAWDGVGAIVETSLDGTTYAPVANGGFATQITNGFNPAGKELSIRISFPDLEGNSSASVSNLRITGYKTKSIVMGSRATSIVGTIAIGKQLHHIEYADDWGYKFTGAGGLVISPPGGDVSPTGPGTVEMWIKNLSTNNSTVVDLRTAANTGYLHLSKSGTSYTWNGTLYVNGQLVTGTYNLPVGEWVLIHLVGANAVATNINVGQRYDATVRGNLEVGHIGLYPNQLSAADVGRVYSAYMGKSGLQTGEDMAVVVTTGPESSLIYTYDWSIQSIG